MTSKKAGAVFGSMKEANKNRGSIKKKKPRAKPKPLTDKQWLETQPEEAEIAKNALGRLHIPIEKLRPLLDRLNWSTRNYRFQLYKDAYGVIAATAAIELYVSIDGKERVFTGAYNLSSIAEPINGFWNGTLKSECIKNAAIELGARLGRGLNKDNEPSQIENGAIISMVQRISKHKPDSKIMQQYLAAVEKGDQAAITTLKNIYEIEPETNHVEQEQNIGN